VLFGDYLLLWDNLSQTCSNGHYYCSEDHLRGHQSADLECYPFEVRESEEFGRFFVATRDISPLELVLIDQPAVVGPATKTKPICLECLKGPLSLSTSIKCDGCHFPLCQNCHVQLSNNSRKLHTVRECNILAKCERSKAIEIEKDSILYATIFLLRMCLLEEDKPGMYKRLHFLMDGDTSDLQDKDSFSWQISKILQCDMGLVNLEHEDVVRLMGIKRTNGSTLLTVDLPAANAIYPIYNLMNSQCYCNTRCSIEEGSLQMSVRAQVFIRKGEEITTRYYPPWEGQPIRQDKVSKHWQYLCGCERCKDPTEFGTYFSAIRCADCLDGYLLPMNLTKVVASPWSCNSCENKLSYFEIMNTLSKVESEIQKWTNTKPIETWSELINLIQESVHPNHYLIFDLKKTMVSQLGSCKDLQFLEDNLTYCQEVLTLVNKLDPGLTPQYAFLLKMTAMTRAELVKALKLSYPDNENVSKRCTELSRKAMAEFRMGAMCLNPKKSSEKKFHKNELG
jgi:hypothetical protein